MQYIPYIISIVSLTVLFVVWFVIVYRDLSHCWGETRKAAEVITMHKISCEESQDGPNAKQAEKMLEISQSIYIEVSDKYNHTRNKLLYRFPAWILGFKRI